MSESIAKDSILKGRLADPAIRQGISLVDYPEYLIAEVLGGDGLQQAHGKLASENLTPEAAAHAITEMIVEHLAGDIEAPEGTPEASPPEKPRVSFVPTISARFPKPVISKIFGKKPPSPEEPVFDDDAAPINFDSPKTASLLLRTEAVTKLWRQDRIGTDRAAHLVETAVKDYLEHQQRN